MTFGGAVIWITGLSGAGKTTVAKLVSDRLRSQGCAVVHLDGDDLRRTLPHLGYEWEERLALARHYAGLANIFHEQGLIVVVSTVSLFHEIHARNRALFRKYLEVLLSVPLEVLRQRDARKVYATPLGPPVIGIDMRPEMPSSADVLRLENHGAITPEHCADAVLRAFLGIR